MAGKEHVFETRHDDVIHDTQYDYYGRYLATGSSDRTAKIFAVAGEGEPQLRATLTGHEGPVWMVAWAHPRFGDAVATASYDHRAIVWKGSNNGSSWKPVHIITCHHGSVNAVQFAPEEFGLLLATASSDGSVCATACADGVWREPVRVTPTGGPLTAAHALGAIGVSFAPFRAPAAGAAPASLLLASCGCDCRVRVWTGLSDGSWPQLLEFAEHKDWVRDVAFSPDASSKYIVLASCSQDKTLVIRRVRAGEESSPANWETSVTTFPDVLWRLSWSPCGTMLLVTTEASEVFLMKQGAVFSDEWLRSPVAGVEPPAAAA